MNIDYDPDDYEAVVNTTLLALIEQQEDAYEIHDGAKSQYLMIRSRSDIDHFHLDNAERHVTDCHRALLKAKKRVAMKKFSKSTLTSLLIL